MMLKEKVRSAEEVYLVAEGRRRAQGSKAVLLGRVRVGYRKSIVPAGLGIWEGSRVYRGVQCMEAKRLGIIIAHRLPGSRPSEKVRAARREAEGTTRGEAGPARSC